MKVWRPSFPLQIINWCETARMFTIVRHPIERVQSLFYSLSISEHISLEMWARSRRVESNRLTRFLSNQLEGELTQNHLDTAKRKSCAENALLACLKRRSSHGSGSSDTLGGSYNPKILNV